MDFVNMARTARENLARGLSALQSPGVPPALMSVAEPIAQAMSCLHRIETTGGADITQLAPTALGHVRKALADLQAQPVPHPAVDQALEAVAGSLGVVHQLSQAIAAPPTQPSNALPLASQEPEPQVAVVPPPAPAGAWQPQPAPAQPAWHDPAQGAAQAPYQQPPAQAAWQPQAPPQPAPAQPAWQQPAAPPQWQQPAAAPVAPQPVPQPVAVPQAAPAPQPAPVAPPVALAPAAHAPQPAAPAPAPAAQSWGQQTVPSGTDPNLLRYEAALGAHSPTNFYKGLSGNDVIDSGGLFIATYQIPPIGKNVQLKVSLPGGYEFEAMGVVRWTREASSSGSDVAPGFGVQFTHITPEGRQLVYRYVRNREPIFHDDL